MVIVKILILSLQYFFKEYVINLCHSLSQEEITLFWCHIENERGTLENKMNADMFYSQEKFSTLVALNLIRTIQCRRLNSEIEAGFQNSTDLWENNIRKPLSIPSLSHSENGACLTYFHSLPENRSPVWQVVTGKRGLQLLFQYN